MKTIVTTTKEVTAMGSMDSVKCEYNQEVYFTSGKITYRYAGKVIDGGNTVVLGSNEKGYKAFNLTKCEMRNTTLTTVVTKCEPSQEDVVVINVNNNIYEIIDAPSKGIELEIGKLYADSLYRKAAIMRLVKIEGDDMTFEVIHQPIDEFYYDKQTVMNINIGSWYPVNDNEPVKSEYVGIYNKQAYYATNKPVVKETMQVGDLYATGANSCGEQSVYELLEITKEGYPVMQVMAGNAINDTRNSGITTFCNPENEWFMAYKEDGRETVIGDYTITPVVVRANDKELVFGSLYADVNDKNATVFQYKGVTANDSVLMQILHNGADYCAKDGSVICFPNDKGTFNKVRYNN